MIPLKDDQVDRRKMEVQQCMESKRTNSPIDFLRPWHSPIYWWALWEQECNLTSYWCKSHINSFQMSFVERSYVYLKMAPSRWTSTIHLAGVWSVPMALGKHLFPYRTQQLSPAAVTILGQSKPGKIARCRFIVKASFNGGFFFY